MKKRLNEIQKAETPVSIIAMLAGAEKPTIGRAMKIENLANKVEITFTKKEIQKFDRDLIPRKKEFFY